MCADTPDFARALKEAGLRVTQQRVTVMSVLMDCGDHPNADEVLARAKGVDDSISLATVYRTLASLEEAGIIRKLAIENAPARYESTPAAEHDHIVDIDTGEVIEIASDEINLLREKIVQQLGYDIISQTTLIRARKRG